MVIPETQTVDQLTQSSFLAAGGWVLPGIAIAVGIGVVVLAVMVIRERQHRRRREALESQLADLEGILVGLTVRPPTAPIPITDHHTAITAPEDDSFSPRGPLSTAISILRSDNGLALPGPDRVDLRATCHIYENLEQSMTPTELAEDLSLSLRSLQRGLASSLGCTPRELILAIKMREAKRCLIEDEARVQEAARLVGYDDPFHFSRRFKAYYGVSPTEMQERINRSVA